MQEKPKLIPVPPILAEGIDRANQELARYEANDFSDRIQTGIAKLDRRLRGGLKGGQLTLIGAPSGGGKSSLAMQIAVNAAKRGPVLFASPEMGIAELAEREIIRRSGRELWDRNPWNRSEGLKEFTREAHFAAADGIILEKLPLHVIDHDVSMCEIEMVANDLSTKGLVLVVIDYAQQVASSDPELPRYLQVGAIGERSVQMAMLLKVPVIVASQVNVAKDGNSKSYSFRETAILEHKAHNVLVLEVDWIDQDGRRQVDDAHIVCTKQRSGEAFRLRVKYEPALYRISDVEDEPREWQRQLPQLPEGR